MTDRSVSVKLRLQIQEYEKNGAKAAGINERLAAGLRAGGKAGDEFARGTDRAKESTRGLSAEIQRSVRLIEKMSREIKRTGDLQLLPKLREEQGRLRQMLAVPGMVNVSGWTKLLKGVMGNAVGGAFAALPPQAKAAIGGAVAAAILASASLIGAAFSGALTAGVAAGGIGVGVAAAIMQDQRIKAAGKGLGLTLRDELFDATQGFLDPAYEGISLLQRRVRELQPQMRRFFDTLAPGTVPLFGGIADMVENVFPGLIALAEMAQPALYALAAEMPELGDSISDFFESIAQGGDGAIMGLIALMDVLQFTIEATGETIQYLTTQFEMLVEAGNFLYDVFGPLTGLFPMWANSIKDGADAAEIGAGGLDKIRNRAAEAGIEIKELKAAWDELFGAFMTKDEAILNYEEALDKLAESVKENGTDLRSTTEAGRANQRALLDQVDALDKIRKANIDNGMSIGEANQKFVAGLGVIQKNAEALGFNGKKVDELIGKYGEIPQQIVTKINADTSAAEAKIAHFRDKYGNITFNIPAPGVTPNMYAKGGITAAASGLIAGGGIAPQSAGPLIMFNEPRTGGEGFLPRKGIPRQRGLDLLSTMASWYQAGVVAFAKGGVTAAAGGLILDQSGGGGGGSLRLDRIDQVIGARDAVQSLTDALKENGKAFAISTTKGRQNVSAIRSAGDAAAEVAQAVFAETGSVTKANKAYAEHIAMIEKALRAKGVSAKQAKALVAQNTARPVFGVATSSAAIALTESQIDAEEAIRAFADKLSINKPVFNTTSEVGGENFGALFSLLRAAQDAAQSSYDLDRNFGRAAGIFNAYLAQARKTLIGSGLSASAADALLNKYGKLAITPNAAGGVYGPMVGLGSGGMWDGAGDTLYGMRERGTGGELFLPRFGDQARGEQILRVGAGWYGGSYSGAGGGDTNHTTINNTLNVNPLTANFSAAELEGLQRGMDARARVGRRR